MAAFVAWFKKTFPKDSWSRKVVGVFFIILGLASLVGGLLKESSNFVQKTPPERILQALIVRPTSHGG
ncbi:TPA: hypothetical protein DEB72_00450 [Patescibacteria group bacterium]|nr:hypothetical protein [Patescibacteria group bacterium]